MIFDCADYESMAWLACLNACAALCTDSCTTSGGLALRVVEASAACLGLRASTLPLAGAVPDSELTVGAAPLLWPVYELVLELVSLFSRTISRVSRTCCFLVPPSARCCWALGLHLRWNELQMRCRTRVGSPVANRPVGTLNHPRLGATARSSIRCSCGSWPRSAAPRGHDGNQAVWHSARLYQAAMTRPLSHRRGGKTTLACTQGKPHG